MVEPGLWLPDRHWEKYDLGCGILTPRVSIMLLALACGYTIELEAITTYLEPTWTVAIMEVIVRFALQLVILCHTGEDGINKRGPSPKVVDWPATGR